MGTIESAYKYEDQLSSQWDLKIHSLDGKADKIKFKVQSTSIPFSSFDVERKKSGELAFKGYKEIDNFSVTLRESSDFSTFKFFQDWQDKFYNRDTRTFNTFYSKADYYKSLYNIEITFYVGMVIAIGIPYIDVDTMRPSYSFFGSNCKPIAIENLSLDYSGSGPLVFSVSFACEKTKLYSV